MSLSKKILFFFVFVVLWLVFSKPVFAATYYVDIDIIDINVASSTPDCTNYNPSIFQCSSGTDSVYKSIADLNTKTFSPGDYILFKRGAVWYLDIDNVGLTLLGSGVAGNQIIIDAFGTGDKPLLTGETAVGGTGLPTGWTQANLLDTTIVSNGTMESGGEGNPPTDWSNVSNGTSLVDTTQVYGDTYSLKFTRDAVGSDGYVKNTNTTVTEGVRYYISAWVWVDDASKVELWEKISSSSDFVLVDSSNRTGNWGWEKLTGFATAAVSTSTAEVMLKVYGSDGQITYIDDVTVQPPEATADSYYRYTDYDPNRIVTYTKDGSTTALKHNDGAEMNVGLFEWNRTTSGWLYVNVGEDPDSGVIKVSRVGWPVRFIGNEYVTIRNIDVRYATVHGFTADSSASNLIFDGITSQWNGLEGVSLDGVTNTTIQNSLITYNGRNGIYAFDGSAYLLITNNEISYNGLLGLLGDRDGIGLGGDLGQNDNGVISYNNIHHNYAHGATTYLTNNLIVEYNTLTDNNYTNPITLGDIYFGYGYGNIARYNYISSPTGIGFQGVSLSRGGYSNHSAYYNVINCTTNASGNYGIHADQTPVNVGNILIANNTIYSCGTGIYTHLTFVGGTITSKNNIAVVDGATDQAVVYRKTDMVTSDYNLFYTLFGDNSLLAMWGDAISYNQNQWSDYVTASGQDINSLIPTDPGLVDPTNNNFYPTATSAVIDAGVNIFGLTTDYSGNPIYGTPDIGAYEYQPPYTVGTNEIDTGGNIRIYADGKFRNTTTTSGTTADLSITPIGGFSTGDYSQWMDIVINTWNTSGDYSKSWTESSTTLGNTAITHTIGDLVIDQYYDIKVDNQVFKTHKADGNGQITFDYTGGYSTKTFEVIAVPTPTGSVLEETESCNLQNPGIKVPNIYSTSSEDLTSVKLYFTQADQPFDRYFVRYGTQQGDYIYSGEFKANGETRTLTIDHLSSNTKYYFQIRAGNGCASGEWSNEFTGRTLGDKSDAIINNNLIGGSSNFKIVNIEAINKQDDKSDDSKEVSNEITVKIKVVDEEGNSPSGIKVILHSDPKEALTDEDGVATFTNVESGEHKVIIEHKNQTGEQIINLSGEAEEYIITIQMESNSSNFSMIQVAGIVGVSLLTFVLLLLLWKRQTRK